MAKKKKAPRKTHSVYVIELKPKVLEQHPKFVKANPNHDPAKACFYVGMTSKTPEERFEQHLKGYKANKYARDFGKFLCDELFCHYNPMTRQEAEDREVVLAEFSAKKDTRFVRINTLLGVYRSAVVGCNYDL